MLAKRAIIVHGHASNPAKYWFGELATCLIRAGCEVLIPAMPHPHLPTICSWKRKLKILIDDDFEETVVIGHSFGGLTALRLAEDLSPGRSLGGIVVVASPVRWVWHRLFPARVLYREPDWIRVRANVGNIAIIHSDDDWIAPFPNAMYMQSKLECELLTLQSQGHILSRVLPTEAQSLITQTLELTTDN